MWLVLFDKRCACQKFKTVSTTQSRFTQRWYVCGRHFILKQWHSRNRKKGAKKSCKNHFWLAFRIDKQYYLDVDLNEHYFWRVADPHLRLFLYVLLNDFSFLLFEYWTLAFASPEREAVGHSISANFTMDKPVHKAINRICTVYVSKS